MNFPFISIIYIIPSFIMWNLYKKSYVFALLMLWLFMLTAEFDMDMTFSSVYSLIMWDFLAYFLVAMALIVSMFAVMASIDSSYVDKDSSLVLLILLNMVVIIALTKAATLITFYVLFEVAAIPIFLIIMGWGTQPEKISASFYIFFFTMVSSAPLIVILFVNFSINSYVFALPSQSNQVFNFTTSSSSLISLALISGMMAKMPMFILHNWLPKAHVEAPVYGSMILAGILLKLGALGLMRVMFIMTSKEALIFTSCVSFIGMIIISSLVLSKTDMKQIVAFSSVVHMAVPIIIMPLMVFSSNVIIISLLVSHAFSSSGMFYLLYVFYMSSGSRNLIIMKGNCSFEKPITMVWLMMIVASLGGPPFFNLMTELLSMEMMFLGFGAIMTAILIPCVIMCAFHIILFTSVGQGKVSEPVQIIMSMTSPLFLLVATSHLIMAVVSSATAGMIFN